MNLKLIKFKEIPTIYEAEATQKLIEDTILKSTYGCCFILDDKKRLVGYSDLGFSVYGQEIIKVPPQFKNLSEIKLFISECEDKYTIYPIVDECGVLISGVYYSEYKIDDNAKIIEDILFSEQNGYDFRHYLIRSKAYGKSMGIYSDETNISSSINLYKKIREIGEQVTMYLPQRIQNDVCINMMDYDVDIEYVSSIKDLACQDQVEIIFINDAKYKRLEHFEIVKAYKKICRYVATMMQTVRNEYLNDYAYHMYKYKWGQAGVHTMAFAIPMSRDLGVKDKAKSPQAVFEFIKKDMANGIEDVAVEMIAARDRFVHGEIRNGNCTYYNDIRSKYFNIINKCRITINQPNEYRNTIYLVGPCIVAGTYVEDRYSIGSLLQQAFKNQEDYRVIAVPVPNSASRYFWFPTLELMQLEPGDWVVWIDQSFRMIEWDYDCFKEYKLLVEQEGNDVYCDRPIHCGKKAMQMVSDKLYDSLCRKIKSDNLNDLKDKWGLYSCTKSKSTIKDNKFADDDELKEYKQFLRENKQIINGAIVMNCNPFTLGHQYLVEYASKMVDYLYIFVVEEDKSYFKFEDRIKLVQLGTAHLNNVKVLPSGKFIISSNTFSEYFDKANLKETIIDTSLDVTIFAEQIAPVLDISVRFVGEEPLDPITSQYNMSMKEILPRYGIELREIPRKEFGEGVISASRVRKCLEESKWDEIEKLVPKTTYDFLISNYRM